MEKTEIQKAKGKVSNGIAWLLIVLQILIAISHTSEVCSEGQKFSQIVTRGLSLPLALNLGLTVELVAFNSLAMLGLVLSLLVWLRQKNKEGKTTTIASIVTIVVSSILYFGCHEWWQPDAEMAAEEMSRAFEGISKEDITKELIEKYNDVPIKYTSLSNGFAVYFPSRPQENTIKNVMGSTVKNYQSVSQDELVQHNVFFHYFDKKIISDKSQEAYLDSYLAGRLLPKKNSRVITNNQLLFNGFNARNYEYVDVVEGVEILHEGIIFILDGDSVSLTCVYPKAVYPQLSFDEFVKSFELLPLEARLSGEYWKDPSTGLMFRPPIDMHEMEKKSRKSIMVTFVNKAGHSLSIINVTADYPSFKLSEIRTEFPQAISDSEGFLINTLRYSTHNMEFIHLMKFLEHHNSIFMLQGAAPKQTFFRSEHILKESMNTVSFGN